MLLVTASSHDAYAPQLVERWRAHGARLLTPRDLSREGWRHDPLDPRRDTAVIDGERVNVAEVDGVLSRLAFVHESELADICAEDRHYVAAELNAFLVSWLSVLEVPVMNRASPAGLAGPNWHPEQWTRLAAELGIRAAKCSRWVRPAPQRPRRRRSGPTAVTVTVVGAKAFGGDESIASAAVRLALAAAVDLLRARFVRRDDEWMFVGADPWPDLAEPAEADAALALLTSGRAAA